MKLISFICLLGIFSTLFSCKSQEYTPETYEGQKITFGSGGGFTGLYSHFAVLKNGQIFEKGPKAETFTFLKKVSKKEVSDFFKQLNQMKKEDVSRNSPGNMNFYVKLEEKESSYELLWASGQEDVDQSILDLYNSMMQLARKEITR